MGLQEYIAVARDVVVATCAAATVVIAGLGLRTWKAEYRGRASHELARRVLRALYQVRDAFVAARSPVIWSGEYPDNYDAHPVRSSPAEKAEEKTRVTAHVYEKRHKPLRRAMRLLDAASLEAEVLWGPEIEMKSRNIRKHLWKYFLSVNDYVDYIGQRATDDSDYEVVRRHAVASLGDKDDSFGAQFDQLVGELEANVRQYLLQ